MVRSLASSATLVSEPATTSTRSAVLIAVWVAAEHAAGVVASVPVPQASKVTVADGFAAFTAAVMPCTALTWSVGSPE